MPVTAKSLFPKIANLARMTKLTKKTGKVTKANKALDSSRGGFINLAEVTTFLPATAKSLFTTIANLARMTKLGKEKTDKVTKITKALVKP